jgi:hypothetical protein
MVMAPPKIEVDSTLQRAGASAYSDVCTTTSIVPLHQVGWRRPLGIFHNTYYATTGMCAEERTRAFLDAHLTEIYLGEPTAK